ncbi:amino acid ABC transporter permease [Thermodesulforhabdus norvegica]|uniref:Amino acid ABC transporter membrane protein 1, PAAT family n=1 Tax=Thermodesulforhabdus norvegica TaxID=39841 RepID=A0A1I4TSQ8_9BACT|nr:amino acid ABC transporter permease [Thermodesulforhabdus norvegica]SFM79610.1 amino acid ABC transporter membrane protein 1, PAAT family [Thermodesulforhabdus norvegica]
MADKIHVVTQALPYVLEGSIVTIGVVWGALFLGMFLGVPIAVIQVYGKPSWKKAVGLYVWFFRGIPLLVLLFLFYFGFLPLLGIDLPPFAVGVIVLGLISSAYQSQIFRGAILSIPEGQFKAARALGMRDSAAIFYIVLPQALRLSIPGWSNEYSIILKDSAVTYALGVPEIMARTHFVATRTYEHLLLYAMAGLVYLVLTYAGTKGLRMLEEKVRIPGYGRSWGG